uniref:Apple domain-containing protein n=1 Tax=Plectus sambesii TaxID=2011161 RepID=A0A914UJ17_9BILA
MALCGSFFYLQLLLISAFHVSEGIQNEDSVCEEADYQSEAALLYEGAAALKSKSAKSVEGCALHCANDPRCQSASWDRVGERCLLYGEVVENVPKFGLSDFRELFSPEDVNRWKRSDHQGQWDGSGASSQLSRRIGYVYIYEVQCLRWKIISTVYSVVAHFHN